MNMNIAVVQKEPEDVDTPRVNVHTEDGVLAGGSRILLLMVDWGIFPRGVSTQADSFGR